MNSAVVYTVQLYWSKKPRSSSQSTLREFRQIVPGDQLVFQIPDLEPDTTYFVQVTDISAHHIGQSFKWFMRYLCSTSVYWLV